jgi:mannan endo-1,4-beta-mannosidase
MTPNYLQLALFIALTSLYTSCKTVSSNPSQLTTNSEAADAFVQTNGAKFTLNGAPFYFQGTNFYRLAVTDKVLNDEELDDVLTKIADSGMRVVRFWGFACETPPEWTTEHGLKRAGIARTPILNRDGQVNEAALVYMDKVVAKAAAKGLKIIFPFVNFEHEYCGMEWWNHVYGNPDESKHAFYCHTEVKSAFKDYIKRIIERRNTVNGRLYRNEPGIMAFEVANEPHTKDHYETKGKVDPSCQDIANGKPGTIVYQWLKEMTDYVRELDPNHLISTGEEGYKTSGNLDKHRWIHDGTKGVDFARNIQLPNVDFATVHLYPDNWSIQAGDDFYDWFVPHVIHDRAELAHAAGKPIVLEETGFSRYVADDDSDFMQRIKNAGYASDRPRWIGEIYKAAYAAGYAGTMVWQAVPERNTGQPYDRDLFTFAFGDPEMVTIREQIARMRQKSKNEFPICESAQADPDGDGWGWENEQSCRVKE